MFYDLQPGRLFLLGVLCGPFNHGWYGMLDKLLPLVNRQSVLKKIALDQAIFGPAMIVAFLVGKYTLRMPCSMIPTY